MIPASLPDSPFSGNRPFPVDAVYIRVQIAFPACRRYAVAQIRTAAKEPP